MLPSLIVIDTLHREAVDTPSTFKLVRIVRSAMDLFSFTLNPKLQQCSSTIVLIKQCSSCHFQYRRFFCTMLYNFLMKSGPSLAFALCVENQGNNESVLVS
jgi:hypothetical protein